MATDGRRDKNKQKNRPGRPFSMPAPPSPACVAETGRNEKKNHNSEMKTRTGTRRLDGPDGMGTGMSNADGGTPGGSASIAPAAADAVVEDEDGGDVMAATAHDGQNAGATTRPKRPGRRRRWIPSAPIQRACRTGVGESLPVELWDLRIWAMASYHAWRKGMNEVNDEIRRCVAPAQSRDGPVCPERPSLSRGVQIMLLNEVLCHVRRSGRASGSSRIPAIVDAPTTLWAPPARGG